MVEDVQDPAIEAFVQAGQQRRLLMGLGFAVVVVAAVIAWAVSHFSTARVVLRVEGADCSPNIHWHHEDERGELVFAELSYAALPWQSPELAFQGRRVYASVIATGQQCANVECQILVDGRQVVREAKPGQTSCSLP